MSAWRLWTRGHRVSRPKVQPSLGPSPTYIRYSLDGIATASITTRMKSWDALQMNYVSPSGVHWRRVIHDERGTFRPTRISHLLGRFVGEVLRGEVKDERVVTR